MIVIISSVLEDMGLNNFMKDFKNYKKQLGQACLIILMFTALYFIFILSSKHEGIKEELFDKTIPHCAQYLKDNIRTYLNNDNNLHDDLWNCMIDNYPDGV